MEPTGGGVSGTQSYKDSPFLCLLLIMFFLFFGFFRIAGIGDVSCLQLACVLRSADDLLDSIGRLANI